MLKGNLLYLLYAAAAGAVGVGGFYVVPQLLGSPENEKPAIVETQPADSGKSDRPVAGKKDEEAETATEVAKVDDEATKPEVTAAPLAPAFDVLRVEPDGSMVVAGSGEPGSDLEVINGAEAIATTKIGPSGDFVAILDEPLPAGDYQLQLKSILSDGTEILSQDIATVSIPDSPDGQLLAMVGKPGEASRILTQPEAKPVEEPKTEVAALNTPESAGETPAVEFPALPSASADINSKAPEIAIPAKGDEEPKAEAQSEVAAVAPEAETQDKIPTPPAVDHEIRVDAVEIEGDRLFVAGAANPGFNVRVLADGEEIGTGKVDKEGRFIIEAVRDLSVGSHEIAAELLTPGEGEIVLRAVVPFERPEGEKMAAVAGAPTPQVTEEAEAPAQDGDAGATNAAGTTPDAQQAGETTANGGTAKTVSQAPLEPAAGSVIIRRGDTLWQISRRTYGQGVRYTTIYLANQQQIQNPDRISPGQVFQVPQTPEPMEDAERVHKELLDRQ